MKKNIFSKIKKYTSFLNDENLNHSFVTDSVPSYAAYLTDKHYIEGIYKKGQDFTIILKHAAGYDIWKINEA